MDTVDVRLENVVNLLELAPATGIDDHRLLETKL